MVLEKYEIKLNKLYVLHLTSVGRGKGIATYYNARKFYYKQEYKTTTMQIVKFGSESLDVINVYRSSNGNTAELREKLIEFMDNSIATLITGDFNLCFMSHGENMNCYGTLRSSSNITVRSIKIGQFTF